MYLVRSVAATKKQGIRMDALFFCSLSDGWIRTGTVVNWVPVAPKSHSLPERVEREISNPIAAIFASDRI